MLFEYHLSKGYRRNLLIDTNKKTLYYIPKNINKIEKIINNYTDFNLNTNLAEISTEFISNSFVEIFECEYNDIYFKLYLELSKINLTEYLIFHISNQLDLDSFIDKVIESEKNGELSIKYCYLVIHNKLNINKHKGKSHLLEFISNSTLLEQRSIFLKNFKASLAVIFESFKYNTFFNKRLYITFDGFIKSYSKSNDKIYIEEAISNIDNLFTNNLSNISKYQIDICKDCEFKNICVDSRIPLKRSENNWYFNTECNYNPYISKWNYEDGYKNLSECGVISNEKEYSINYLKIVEINTVLWGEEVVSK